MSMRVKEALHGIGFAFPSISGVLLLYALPYFKSLFFCFSSGITGGFVGLSNFISLFQSAPYRMAFRNNLIFWTAGIPIIMFTAFLFALIINNRTQFLSIVVIIPLITPTASIVMFFKIIFEENGEINRFIQLCGMETVNFMDSKWATIVLVTMYVWKYLGYNAILYLTAINSIPGQYYDNARLDGASGLSVLTRIIIPFCIPMSFFVFIMSFINSFKTFREIIMLFGVYPNENVYLLQHFMNNNFFNFSYQRLSAAAFIMAAFIIMIVMVCFKLQENVQRNLKND